MEQFGVNTRAAGSGDGANGAFDAGRAVLDASGCTHDLADKLAIRTDGRPFTPVQLMLPQKNAPPASLAQVMQFLMSPRPIGGYEELIAVGQAAANERAMNALSDRLGRAGETTSYGQLLAQTRDAAATERQVLEAELRPLRERFAKADECVRKYQEESVRSAGKSLTVRGLVKAFIGETVSLPEAIKALNDREVAGLDIATRAAALGVLSQVSAACEQLLAGLDAIRVAALTGAQAASVRLSAARREAGLAGRRADIEVSAGAVVESLREPEADTGHLVELIAEARRNGGDAVVTTASALAQRDVHARLDGLDVLGFIRLEASKAPASGKPGEALNGPLTAANHLVDLVRRARPSVRLNDGAKPRTFVLQIAAGERPPFNHSGLVAARYRRPVDELAFLRADADVALDDLQFIHEGEDSFLEAQARREFFVLEELAEVWRVRAEDDLHITLPDSRIRASANGHQNE